MLDKLKSKILEKGQQELSSLTDMVKIEEPARNQRLEICNSCDEFVKKISFCRTCGCYMPVKTWLPKAKCPLKKW